MPDENSTPEPAKRLMPSNSTTVGALGGAGLGPILVWVLQTYTHVLIPAEIAIAIGALLGNTFGYFFEGGRKL